MQKNNTVTIDAKDKVLGRLASEVAALLNAKDSVNFVKNKVAEVKVVVENASQIKVTGKKMKQAVHKTHSGHMGGLKIRSYEYVAAKKGYGELLKHAVSGMLPKNRLQDLKMKNLTVHE